MPHFHRHVYIVKNDVDLFALCKAVSMHIAASKFGLQVVVNYIRFL